MTGRDSLQIGLAIAGITPDWPQLEVIDLETDAVVADAYAVSTRDGWAVINLRNAAGELYLTEAGEVAQATIHGRFAIRRRAPPSP